MVSCGVLLGVVCGQYSVAQHGDLDFFPLASGNAWTYYEVIDPPHAAPDTIIGHPRTVEAATLEGNPYFVFHFPELGVDTVRADEADRIWKYTTGGQDLLLFDFTLSDGSGYQYAPQGPAGESLSYTVTVSRDTTVETHAGRFERCVVLEFDIPEAIDDEIRLVFAPGVGIVRARGAHVNEHLYSAVIDGSVITSAERPARPASSVAISNYPNPFTARTSIRYVLSSGGHVLLEVFDMAGRRVEVLVDRVQPAGVHESTFSAKDRASGTYLYRLQAQGRVTAGSMLSLE